jgi:tRNA threonylcarbamoyladenosine biosynthesis protein TsaE
MISLKIKTIDELDGVAKKILGTHPGDKIFTFRGSMGAGKTTLIKAICKQLGVVDNTSSPTFSIINEYKTDKGQKIYHFDLYRIKNTEEVYDIGYEDYLYSGSYCFIEWPEKIPELIPDTAVAVSITVNGSERVITC